MPAYLWPISLLPIVALWLIVPHYTEYLPSLGEVLPRMWSSLQEGQTYLHLLDTLKRGAIGLVAGYVVGTGVALAMRGSAWWRSFFMTYVFLALSLPSLAIALVALMVFGLSEVGVYVAVAVIVFPFVTLSLIEGFESLDSGRLEMAEVYRFGWRRKLRHVALPEMSSYLFAAFRNANSVAWKIVIVAEVFSQSTGIGYQYKRAYDFFLLAEMVTWLLFFIAVIFCVEYVLVRPAERRVLRWRDG